MKRTLIFTYIFILLLNTSCSFLPEKKMNGELRTPAEAGLSCKEMATQIINNKIKLKESSFNREEYVNIRAALEKKLMMTLSLEEVDDYLKVYKNENIDFDNDDSFLRAIFMYSMNNKLQRLELLKNYRAQGLESQFSPTLEIKKDWEKLQHHHEKVSMKTKEIIKKESKKTNLENAIFKARSFENLYYSCKMTMKTKPTMFEKEQAKKLTYAITAGGLASTVGVYSAVNWDKEKDSKWFNELYFSSLLAVFSNYLAGRLVLTNSNLNPWKGKMPLSFLNNMGGDIGVASAYGYLFQAKDEDLERKVKDIESHPQFKNKMSELIQYAQQEKIIDKYLEQSHKLFYDKRTNSVLSPEEFIARGNFDEIDIESSRDLLMEVLGEQLYLEESGKIKTGSRGLDRFVFNRVFDVVNAPATIATTIVMYNQICMTTNPKVGFMKAFTTFLASSIILDTIYYKGKKEAINQ